MIRYQLVKPCVLLLLSGLGWGCARRRGLPAAELLGLEVREQLVVPLVLRQRCALPHPVRPEFGEGFGRDVVSRNAGLSGQRRKVRGRLPGQVHRKFPVSTLARGRRCRRYLLSSTLIYSVRCTRFVALHVVALRCIALRIGFCLDLPALPMESGAFRTRERAGFRVARVLTERLPAIPAGEPHVFPDQPLRRHRLQNAQCLAVIGAEQAIEGLSVKAGYVAAVVGLAGLLEEREPHGHDVAEAGAGLPSDPQEFRVRDGAVPEAEPVSHCYRIPQQASHSLIAHSGS